METLQNNVSIKLAPCCGYMASSKIRGNYMQKLMMGIVTMLFLTSFSINTLADTEVPEALQLYTKIKLNEKKSADNVKLAPWLSDEDKKNSVNLAPWLRPENENLYEENREIEKLLETMASNGEPNALYYSAMLKMDWADTLLSFRGIKDWTQSDEDRVRVAYDQALLRFKQSGEAGSPAACWNVATIYSKGLGSTTSKLAAIEWYYKAGVGYLKNGYREQSLAALEAIQAIRMDSELGLRLEKELNKGAPK
jgi:hypothetical protein